MAAGSDEAKGLREFMKISYRLTYSEALRSQWLYYRTKMPTLRKRHYPVYGVALLILLALPDLY